MLQLIALLANRVITEFFKILGGVLQIHAVLAYVQMLLMRMEVKCVLLVIIHGLLNVFLIFY